MVVAAAPMVAAAAQAPPGAAAWAEAEVAAVNQEGAASNGQDGQGQGTLSVFFLNSPRTPEHSQQVPDLPEYRPHQPASARSDDRTSTPSSYRGPN